MQYCTVRGPPPSLVRPRTGAPLGPQDQPPPPSNDRVRSSPSGETKDFSPINAPQNFHGGKRGCCAVQGSRGEVLIDRSPAGQHREPQISEPRCSRSAHASRTAAEGRSTRVHPGRSPWGRGSSPPPRLKSAPRSSASRAPGSGGQSRGGGRPFSLTWRSRSRGQSPAPRFGSRARPDPARPSPARLG